MSRNKSKLQAPKIKRKSIAVINSKFMDKDLTTKLGKFKRFVAKTLNIPVKYDYNWTFNIQYQGRQRLKPNDTIISSQGVYFLVYKEQNRHAIIVSANATSERPHVIGAFTILDLEAESKFAEQLLKFQEQRAKEKELEKAEQEKQS